MVKPDPSDEFNHLTAPDKSSYKDSMDEGDGTDIDVLPLNNEQKLKAYQQQDIETGALDLAEDGDSDDEDGPYQKRKKKVTLGGDNSNSNSSSKGNDSYKRKKKSTVGGDDEFVANMNQDEFVIDGDEEDEQGQDHGAEFGRKVTDGYDDEEHDGIVSEANSDNDNRFVIEGGIDENKPLDEQVENYWNEEMNEEEVRTAQDNNMGRESFVVIGNENENENDINILTPDDNHITDNGY